MRLPFALPARSFLRLVGCWLVAFALAVQLAAASVVMLPQAAPGGLANVPICHGAADADGQKAPAHRHAPGCALCPLCQAIAHAGVLLAPPGFALAAPLPERVRPVLPPPARAPPVHAAGAAYPRGPPALA